MNRNLGIVIAAAAAWGSLTSAALELPEQAFYIYEGCSPGVECQSLAAQEGADQKVAATPAMRLHPGNIESVVLEKNASDGRETWSIGLTEAAGKELAALTTRNVKKTLFVVAKNQVLMAPVVAEPVTTGRFMMMPHDFNVAEGLPWLWEMAQSERVTSDRLRLEANRRQGWMYIAMVVALASAVGTFLFLRRRQPTETNSGNESQ